MFRSFATVSGFTALSRVLGFARDILLAAFLGTTAAGDAFVAAFRFPNMFRRIFGEGAFNAAFVPLFGKELDKQGREAALHFANRSFTWLALVLVGGTALAIPGMDFLMAWVTPGFRDDPQTMALTVAYARIAFSYLLCMALGAHLGSVLNTLRIFAMPAFAPVLLNICFLVGLTVVVPWRGLSENPEGAGYVCAWCVFVAGFLQLGALWVACWRQGWRIRPVAPVWDTGMKRLVVLMGPGVVTAGVQQINLLVGTMIASVQDGAMSTLYYADRVNQLPLGLIGIAFYTVLLTEISRTLQKDGEEAAMRLHGRGLGKAMLLTIPATVALCLLAEPLFRVLFEQGVFGASDTKAAADALFWFATGLPAYVLVKVLTPAFFAREDTRRPMHYAFANVGVNVAGSLALFPVFGHVGIAMATSLAGWVNVALLVLGGRSFLRVEERGWRRLGAMMAASGVMGGVLWPVMAWLGGWLSGDKFEQWMALVVLVAAGLATYGAAALALRATRVSEWRGGLREAASGRR